MNQLKKDWIDWCRHDTSKANQQDWHEFVERVYKNWVKKISSNDEAFHQLEGAAQDKYIDDHYDRDSFVSSAEEAANLDSIFFDYINLASVSWEISGALGIDEEKKIIIHFKTKAYAEDGEKISLNDLRKFYLMDLLKLSDPYARPPFYIDAPDDPNDEIRKLLSYYLMYRNDNQGLDGQ